VNNSTEKNNPSRRELLRRGLAVAVGLGSPGLLQACSSSAPSPHTAASTPASTTAPRPASTTAAQAAPTAAAAPVAQTAPAANTGLKADLRMWCMEYKPHLNSFGSMIQAFQKEYPEIAITLQGQPQQEHVAKYQQGFISKTEPDLIAIHQGISAAFVQSGVLEALGTDVFGGKPEDIFFKDIVDPYMEQGKMYGVPLANDTPGIGFIMNLDHFAEAGIDPPTKFASWDDVWAVADKLTKRDAQGNVVRSGMNVRESHILMYVCGFMKEQGKEYFDPASGKFSFNNPEGLAAMQVLHDTIYKYKVDSADIPIAFDSLANGLSSMGMIWIDYIPYAKTQFPDKKFGFAVRPPLKGSKLVVASEGGWGVNVTARSKAKDAAKELMKYLVRDDSQMTWLKEQNALPAKRNLVNDAYFKTADAKWVQAAFATMDTWVSEGPFPVWNLNGNAGAWPIIEGDILGNKVTLSDGMVKIEDVGNKMYQDFKSQVSTLKQ